MPRWIKGQSGNLRGRPPKNRSLSAILAAKSDEQTDGSTNKELLARRLWQFAISGEVELGDRKLKAESASQWLTAVRWIYYHLDGPAPSLEDEAQEVVVRVERIPLPTRSDT